MDLLREKMRLMPMSGPQDSGGGGGGGSTQQQMASTELPEWAKPYAQKILAKGEALTEATTPATYGGQRYAGLSDLQKKAIESVSTPEAYQKTLQGFMDPYAQNVIDIQKREAGRQSQIAGLSDAAQAVKMGAFGGSRAGLVEAERERNLGQLMGDIQAKGSEAAYRNAQQAMQADLVNKLQIGSIEQQDIQKPLDIAYQDFLNQQNYPYKQLGFMSDLIRGLPLGQQSTQQVYQSPGSFMGQLAGLGLGAYGMSRMFGYADGGEVYADGGVTDPRNVESILSKLSDEQLLQAKKVAVNNRDEMQVAMIDQEMAQRASMRHGLGSVPIDFAAYLPDEEAMARGGIVAFAEPTEENNYSLVSDPMGTGASEIMSQPTSTADTRNLFERLVNAPIEPEWKQKAREEAKAPAKPTSKDKEIQAQLEGKSVEPAAPAKTKQAAAPAASISNAARIITDVAKTEVPKDDINKLYDEISAKLNSAPRPEAEALSRMLEKAEKRSEEIKAKGIGDALMKFGFGMAASAAKPGQARRAGLAGVLESAAAASPILAESVAENQKLQAAAEDNALKLRMEQARYQSSLEQGNKQLAASLAGSISQRKLQQAALEEQISQNARANALKEKEIAGISAYRQAVSDPQQIRIAERYMKENPKLSFEEAMDAAARSSVGGIRADQSAALQATKMKQALLDKRRLWAGSDSKYAQEQLRMIDEQIRGIDSALGKAGGAGVGSGKASPGWSAEQIGG